VVKCGPRSQYCRNAYAAGKQLVVEEVRKATGKKNTPVISQTGPFPCTGRGNIKIWEAYRFETAVDGNEMCAGAPTLFTEKRDANMHRLDPTTIGPGPFQPKGRLLIAISFHDEQKAVKEPAARRCTGYTASRCKPGASQTAYLRGLVRAKRRTLLPRNKIGESTASNQR